MHLKLLDRGEFNNRTAGFSTQQALIILLAIFPLGVIALGVVLLVAKKHSQTPVTKAEEPKPAIASRPGPTGEASATNPTQTKASTRERAQPSMSGTVELGPSVSGAPIHLLMGSIQSRDQQFTEFQYQLGTTTVQAMANCSNQSWTSYPERQVNRPQSPATERMLSLVCRNAPQVNQTATAPTPNPDALYPGVAVVFDPPSNVRTSPGGAFLCTVNNQRTIPVGQAQGEWYPTSACGSQGFIHRSQVRF